MTTCQACGRPLPEDGHTTLRRYCSGSSTCRVTAHRSRQAVRRDLAESLLMRQTAAILAGDRAQLAAIAAEAERLFGTDDEGAA